ncbi:hypothetical protein [Actinoplanes sp. N902-109]|uniref:hypothetical protein n=1 Tax=Actinoplanes sp. (strain N902-109) TaxID=649831 RepID=UPI0003295E19|nr:hypothetical protein [Actinoplanes sp. N902-109]AGL18294.1 hypothetical protein L083_4784 [Actinoplanes sp. N902-109]
MLVQLNRTDQNELFAPNPAASVRRADAVVAVLGYPGRVAGLAAHLPTGWSVRFAAGLDDIHPGDIVLISGALPADVTTARALLPRRTCVVTLLDDDAPAGLVAAVLTAGADVCVRGGQPAVLAGHLVACRRRRLTDRWVDVEARLR